MIQIAGRRFNHKTDVERHIRQLFGRYANHTDTEPVSGEDQAFVHALIDLHPRPNTVQGEGIREVRVQRLPNGHKRFLVVRRDSSWFDVSWRRCLNPRSRMQDVLAVCRHLAEPQIKHFRAFFWRENRPPIPCPILGIPVTDQNAHVDHAPPVFADLVAGWLRADRLDPDEIEIVYGTRYQEHNRFADALLAHSWAEYHAINARLRVVSARANVSTLRRSA